MAINIKDVEIQLLYDAIHKQDQLVKALLSTVDFLEKRVKHLTKELGHVYIRPTERRKVPRNTKELP